MNDALQEAREEAVLAAAAFARELERGTSQDVRNVRNALRQFDPRFVEARVIRGVIDGESQIDPRYLEESRKYAVDIKVPVTHAEHPPEMFVVAYDIQHYLGRLVNRVRFGDTGYIVVVNDDGRIIAHRDPARIHDDVSGDEAVRRVRSGDKKKTNPSSGRTKPVCCGCSRTGPCFCPTIARH